MIFKFLFCISIFLANLNAPQGSLIDGLKNYEIFQKRIYRNSEENGFQGKKAK